MLEEIIAVIHSIGVTLHQDPAGIDRARRRLCGAVLLLGLQSGPALVAQARARHRSLLLVHHPAVRALSAHRAAGARRRLAVRHHHRRGAGRVLRRRPRPAGAIAALAAGGDLPGWLGFHDVLDPPRASIARRCGNTTPCITPPRTWTGSRRRASIRSISSSAASPTDVVLLLAGISPNVLVFLGPFTIAHSAFVHANLNWTLGPFKYVLAGPVFHRWHHTAAERGGEKNFASTFPVIDLAVRHVLHAEKRAAGRLWRRRSGAFRRASARRCSIRSSSERT